MAVLNSSDNCSQLTVAVLTETRARSRPRARDPKDQLIQGDSFDSKALRDAVVKIEQIHKHEQVLNPEDGEPKFE